MTSIGCEAFAYCGWMLYITIPSSVKYIGGDAFGHCSSFIINYATIPQKIEDDTFSRDTQIFVPYGCKAAYEEAEYWKNFEIIENAFTWELSDDGTLTISGTSMPDNVFYPWRPQCDKIKKIVIEDGMTNVGFRAFANCSELTSVTIPASVTSLGDRAFEGCTGFTSVTILSTTPPAMSNGCLEPNVTIHVLAGCKASYEVAEFWKDFTIVEDATTGIDAVEGSAMISEDNIFSISGQRLDKAAKGVNIINGKKVLVK